MFRNIIKSAFKIIKLLENIISDIIRKIIMFRIIRDVYYII